LFIDELQYVDEEELASLIMALPVDTWRLTEVPSIADVDRR
jgi:hypothetical protein